jgi:phosphoribosylformylglycinamidine cyclo-ligase
MKKKSGVYARAGVNLEQARRDKTKTFATSHQFAGLFRAHFPKMKNPILVASTDGVGSKLMLASQPQHHSLIAADLVYHCVNDILTCGAQPLFFLDYISFKKWDSKIFHALIRGFKKACFETGCSLIGGETAQLPEFFSENKNVKYDLSGTIVGVVDEKECIGGKKIQAGDAIIGLPSNGLHTNGYTLARKILFQDLKMKLTDRIPGSREILGALLRKPHRCYLKEIQTLQKKIQIKGMAHITGGGLIENLARILPSGFKAQINKNSWPIPPLFSFLQKKGKLTEKESFRVFNMGIGFAIIVNPSEMIQTLSLIKGFYLGKILSI